MISIWR